MNARTSVRPERSRGMLPSEVEVGFSLRSKRCLDFARHERFGFGRVAGA